LEAIFILVVVAFAGRDLLETPAFLVNWMELVLKVFDGSGKEVVDATSSEAMLPAAEMLSRATSVTAAAFCPRGQVLVVQP
jgi:F0F1-type ATP synthase membrane subunit a